MDGLVKVCGVSDVAPGSMRTFQVSGKPVAVANVGGDFFAVSDTCTHEACSLGTDGVLDGNVILCGCHGGQFDVMNGHVVAPPPMEDVRSYPVTVSDNTVFIKI